MHTDSRVRFSQRLGDYRRVLLAATELVSCKVALLTITGPGWAALENDPGEIRRWNKTSAPRFGKLDRRVKGKMRREGTPTPRVGFRIAQRQQRGVDHLHIGLLLDGFADRRAIERYVELLKMYAAEYGFGWVDDPFLMRHPKGSDGRPNRALPKRNMVFEDAAIAGRYLVRYLTEKAGQLEAMLRAGDYSFRPMWVAPALTQASGCNMRRLRRVRHAYHVVTALSQGSRPTIPVWWRDIGERHRVLRLLKLKDGLPPPSFGVAGI